MKPELNLFIIWPKARYLENKILHDIEQRFEVIDVCEITWSEKNYSSNLTRFYGVKLPRNSHKERHCGRGPFLLIVVRDLNPIYDSRQTSKGIKSVSITPFDAKTRYRKWTGGGHKIHATNNPSETRHDLSLLFGTAAKRYFNGSITYQGKRTVRQDIAGADGWNDIEELFYVLNNTINYVVLRNFEPLPDEYTMESHGDIDLLVNDYIETVYVTNSKKVFRPSYRVHHEVEIKNEKVRFDFRFIGDNYYDKKWELNILKGRIVKSDIFYIPSSEDYFYSLLYHGLVHKQTLGLDYRERLMRMSTEMGISSVTSETFNNAEAAKKLLTDYLCLQGYSFTEPDDLSVYYNEKIVGKKRISLLRRVMVKIKYLLSPLKSPFRLLKNIIKNIRETTLRLYASILGN